MRCTKDVSPPRYSFCKKFNLNLIRNEQTNLKSAKLAWTPQKCQYHENKQKKRLGITSISFYVQGETTTKGKHDAHTGSGEKKLVVKGIPGKLGDTRIWMVFPIIISMFTFWTIIIVFGYIGECSGFSGCTKHTWVKCHHQICNSQMVQLPSEYRSSMCRQWVREREREKSTCGCLHEERVGE